MQKVIPKIINSVQKTLSLSFKNLKRLLTGEEKILVLSFKILLTSFGIILLCFSINIFSFSNVSAEDLDYNITIQPSLNLTTSATDIKLNLNPATNPFASEDLTVSVGTNNETGYKLYISSINNTTNLIEENDNNLYIETLESEIPETNFPSNRWGYKLNSTNDKYIPFTTGNMLVSSSDQATNSISKTLVFAAKAGYETKPGTYNLALKFEAVANPLCNITVEGTMQEFDPCPDLEDGTTGTLTDIRDGNTYSVTKINGGWWMTQNLRYKGDTGSASGSMVMKSATSNIDTDTTISYTDLTSGNSVDAAKIHDSGNTDFGVYYNYPAASAMTITGSSNTTTANYDICPGNWKLPSDSETGEVTSSISIFSPVEGGRYYSGSLGDTGKGYWWSTTSYSTGARYVLAWTGSVLGAGNSNRQAGHYIRCIRST